MKRTHAPIDAIAYALNFTFCWLVNGHRECVCVSATA